MTKKRIRVQPQSGKLMSGKKVKQTKLNYNPIERTLRSNSQIPPTKMEEMNKTLAKIREENAEDRKERKKEYADIKAMFTEERERWANERKEMEKKIESLEKRLQMVEKNERRNNIVITNWETNKIGRELQDEMQELFSSKVGERIQVVEARRWTVNEKTMIMARLPDLDTKITILKNRMKMNQTIKGVQRPIYVEEDRTREERAKAYKARKLREERRQNKEEAVIKYEKGEPVVVAGGKKWRWNRDTEEYVIEN